MKHYRMFGGYWTVLHPTSYSQNYVTASEWLHGQNRTGGRQGFTISKMLHLNSKVLFRERHISLQLALSSSSAESILL